MNWLVLIDSSLQGIAVGFTPVTGDKAGQLVWFRGISKVQDSAAELPIVFEEGRLACGAEFHELLGASLAVGPGSFTGLRVGLSYAYGLSAGISSRVASSFRWRGVSSLALLASEFGRECASAVIVALPSTKTTGFFARWQPEWESAELGLLDLQAADISHLTATANWMVIGEWPQLESHFSMVKMKVLDAEAASRKALTAIALDAVRHWPSMFSVAMPTPNYMKKSTVEERALADQGL